MNAALWISKTGLSAQDAEMSAIANNIANVNTTGFKRDRVMFQDLFYQTQEAPAHLVHAGWRFLNEWTRGAYATGQTAKTRAGYPTPSRTLGKVQKMTAPVAGSSSRWSMTSI